MDEPEYVPEFPLCPMCHGERIVPFPSPAGWRYCSYCGGHPTG